MTNILYKKLLFQANHRGLKEADVLLGGFAAFFIQQNPSDTEVLSFLAFLDTSDWEIFENIKNPSPHFPFAHWIEKIRQWHHQTTSQQIFP